MYIRHNKLVSVDNVLRQYDDMKEKMKNLKSSTVHENVNLIIVLSYCLKRRKRHLVKT